jgi:hypothetical protein
MSDTVINDPTADQGPFRINPPGEGGGLEMPTGLERGASLTDRARADPTPGSTKLEHQLEAEGAASEKEHQDIVNRRNAAYSELHRREGQRPAIPNQQQLGPPPDAREYHKHSMAWAGAMAMIGALSAKAGRMSGTQALDAFSGAMKGWNEGNLQAYTEATEHWQNQNARTLENNRQLLEKYQMVMNNHRMNIDQQMAEIERISVEERDNMVWRLAKEKNWTAIAQLQDNRHDLNKKLERVTAPLQAEVDKGKLEGERIAQQYGPLVGPNFENLDKFKHKDGTPWTNQEKQNIRYNIEKYGPPDVGAAKAGSVADIIARKEALLGRKLTPDEELDVIHQMKPQSQPRSAPAMAVASFKQRYADEHGGQQPGPDEVTKFAATYVAAVSRARAIGARSGTVDVTARDAALSAKVALQRSDDVPRGDWVPLTQLKQAAERKGSNPALGKFDLANSALITAYAGTMSKGGVTSVEAQKRAIDVLNTADSPEVYKAKVAQLIQETEIMQQAVRDVEAESGIGGGGGGAAGGGAGGKKFHYDNQGNEVQ